MYEYYAWNDYNLHYLIVNSVVSSYQPPLQRERGGVRKISPNGGVEHICIYLLIYKTTNKKTESTEKGWELSLNRHFMEHGQTHAWADFNPTQAVAGFNSHKMTANLGSGVGRNNLDKS